MSTCRHACERFLKVLFSILIPQLTLGSSEDDTGVSFGLEIEGRSDLPHD